VKPVYLPDEQAFIRYVEIPGADPPLLWLHGWQCSSTGELMPAAVQAVLRGRHSLLIDFLGHGYSDRPPAFPYTREAHARTIVSVIDALGVRECGLVGHSMGGAVAVHVAANRPDIVSLLVMAEGALDAGGDEPFGGISEERFLAHGFRELLEAQAKEALAQPDGLRAAHLGITRVADPAALHREGLSLHRGTNPSVRSLLRALRAPRWYLHGELSDPDPELERDLVAMGVEWKVVPKTGHAMGIQNPEGLAQAVANAVVASWPRDVR
jgi:pimeloyl-ACP methyl ester carboxylesterase